MKPKDVTGRRKPAARSVMPPAASGGARKTKADTAAPGAPPIVNSKNTSRARPLKIPPILLEGDEPPAPALGGPGQRYVLAPAPAVSTGVSTAVSTGVSTAAELPESYGTQQLFLTARDPRWLHAHWDFSRAQLKTYNALAAEGHLALRVYGGAAEGKPLGLIALHPESRSWFIPVPLPGAKYVAELGYHDSARKWVSLARSGATFTPPESASQDASVRFATIPPEVPFADLLAAVKEAAGRHTPLAEALWQLGAQGHQESPPPSETNPAWTPAREKALAEAISIDHARQIWIGSLEITELIRRQLQGRLPSTGAAEFNLPSSLMGAEAGQAGVSSPFGGAERPRGFWFNVNAELIIYGATEPGAEVTVGGRPIQLRPDGSFSLRYALPDGHYSLPLAAQSAAGGETRRANLKFSRETTYHGEVGEHWPDVPLEPPLASALA